MLTPIFCQVIWHPGTFYDNYLVVLMSDNFLRIYNVDEIESSNFRPEQVQNFH